MFWAGSYGFWTPSPLAVAGISCIRPIAPDVGFVAFGLKLGLVLDHGRDHVRVDGPVAGGPVDHRLELCGLGGQIGARAPAPTPGRACPGTRCASAVSVPRRLGSRRRPARPARRPAGPSARPPGRRRSGGSCCLPAGLRVDGRSRSRQRGTSWRAWACVVRRQPVALQPLEHLAVLRGLLQRPRLSATCSWAATLAGGVALALGAVDEACALQLVRGRAVAPCGALAAVRGPADVAGGGVSADCSSRAASSRASSCWACCSACSRSARTASSLKGNAPQRAVLGVDSSRVIVEFTCGLSTIALVRTRAPYRWRRSPGRAGTA